METIHGNGITYKIRQESDGWWSIYKEHDVTKELIPLIQAKDKEHALNYINLAECPRVPFNVL